MKSYDKSNTLSLLNYCKSTWKTNEDAAFKLKAINLAVEVGKRQRRD